MSPVRLSTVLAALALAGCGAARQAPDITAYEQLLTDAQASVQHHRTAATSASSMQACQDEHTRYAAEMQAMVTRVRQASGDVDGCMMDMGHRTDADLTTTCDAMNGELARHARDACASTDMATNQAEATRHCDAMKGYLDHEGQRAQMMGGMMGSAGMMAGASCMP